MTRFLPADTGSAAPAVRPHAALTCSHPARRRAARVLAALLVLVAAPALACTGDCNGDRTVSIDELLSGVRISLGSLAVASCPSFDRTGDGAVRVDELIAATGNALQGCRGQTQAFVVTSDFTTGAYAMIGLDLPRPVVPASPHQRIYRDAVVRTHDGLVYVLNRLFADNVQVLDPADGFRTRLQCSTGLGTNPHDIAFASATKAYVTRLERPQLLIVNPAAQPNCSDFTLGTIDLSALADGDGNPDMAQMAIVDGLLYVALERLDINTVLRTPASNGALAIIDTATDAVVGSIELTGMNPFGATKGLIVRDGALYVAEAGFFGTLDGGIERVNLASRTAEGFIITEKQLGGDVTDFVLVSDALGYAIVGEPGFRNALVAFDPRSGTVTATLHEADGATLFDIELNDRGELYVADRARRNSGIRVFRAADGVALVDSPLDLVLPPFELVFIP